MTDVTASPLDKELRPPAHLADILARIAALYRNEVAPRELAMHERLADETKYLDVDGRLHPEILAARREIMRAAGRAGVYSAHLPQRLGGGGLGRTDMIYVEEQVYGYGCGLNPALLSWSEGATPRLLYCHDHQREEFVDPLVRGEKTSLHAVTETGAGSNLFDMTLNLATIGTLHFGEPDLGRFPCLRLAIEAGTEGGTLPAVMAAADEVAVERFLRRDIGFLDIPAVIRRM